MFINNNDGFFRNTKRRRKGFRVAKDPATKQDILIPINVHPDEIVDEEEQLSKEIRAFASHCLKHCKVAVIGHKDYDIVGAKFVRCSKVTPGAIRSAARLAVQAGWKKVVLATQEELDQKTREAAYTSFDVCLIKADIFVNN